MRASLPLFVILHTFYVLWILDIGSHASLFWDSDTHSTISYVEVISGHSCLLISFILSLMYWGVDNPTFVGMHTFLPYCFISNFKFSIYVYFSFCGVMDGLGGMNACGVTRLVIVD